MALIRKGDANVLTIDAILTEAGKESLSNGTFNVSYFKLCDDEIDYSLYNSSTGNTQTNITNIPIFEGCFDTWQNLKYYLSDSVINYSISISGMSGNVIYKNQSQNIIFTLNPVSANSTFTLKFECFNNFNDVKIGNTNMTGAVMYINDYKHGDSLSLTSTNPTNQQLKITAFSNEFDTVSISKIITFSSNTIEVAGGANQ